MIKVGEEIPNIGTTTTKSEFCLPSQNDQIARLTFNVLMNINALEMSLKNLGQEKIHKDQFIHYFLTPW